MFPPPELVSVEGMIGKLPQSQCSHAIEPIDYEHEHRPTRRTEHEHDGIL
jgi:hypothetical protein